VNILTLCLSKDLGGLELYAFRSTLSYAEKHKLIFVTSPDGKLSEKAKNAFD